MGLSVQPHRFSFIQGVLLMNKTVLALALVLVLGLHLSGCSGDRGTRATVFSVTGKITIAGGPLASAVVAFAPEEGQPTAIGRTNDQGVYTLTTYDSGDGAAKGKYAVTVSKYFAEAPESAGEGAEHGPQALSTSHSSKSGKAANNGNLVPQAYSDSTTTPLKFTVEEKANTADFEVK